MIVLSKILDFENSILSHNIIAQYQVPVTKNMPQRVAIAHNVMVQKK